MRMIMSHMFGQLVGLFGMLKTCQATKEDTDSATHALKQSSKHRREAARAHAHLDARHNSS